MSDACGREEPWLVVVDPQRVFAAPDSPWGSPMFASVVEPVCRLASEHDGRVIVTRWLPAAEPRTGSWAAYFDAWPFADRPGDDPLFEIVAELAAIAARAHRVEATTFAKWPALEHLTGPVPHLTLCGVSTDCCIIATALAAADAGATVRVVAQACAGSTPQAHQKALDVMALFAPQIVLS